MEGVRRRAVSHNYVQHPFVCGRITMNSAVAGFPPNTYLLLNPGSEARVLLTQKWSIFLGLINQSGKTRRKHNDSYTGIVSLFSYLRGTEFKVLIIAPGRDVAQMWQAASTLLNGRFRRLGSSLSRI